MGAAAEVYYGKDLRNLSLANPDGRVLLEQLGLTIRRGEHVLISGDPTVTIALFKAIAGLWPWGHGEILLPAGQSIVFLPQRPFLPDGPCRPRSAIHTAPAISAR